MRKIILCLVAVVLIAALGIGMGLTPAQETTELDAAKIESALADILENQDRILQQLEQMEQELAIIKVRASR